MNAARPAVTLLGCRVHLRLAQRVHLQMASQAIANRVSDWREKRNCSTITSQLTLQNQIRLMSAIPTPNGNNTTDTTDNIASDKLTTRQQAKHLLSKYGTVFIGTYLGVYITTLISLFVSLENGILDVDMLSSLREVVPLPHVGLHIGVSDGFFDGLTNRLWDFSNQVISTEKMEQMKHEVKNNPHLSNLAIAWITVKFTEPLRLAASVVLCPRIASLFGRSDEWRASV